MSTEVVTDTVATDTMVRVENVHRSYGSGTTAVHALRGVSFDIPRGELVALKGRSGSGKTTLLNLVGGLDEPDGGGSPSTGSTSPGSARTGCSSCAGTVSASSSSPSGSSRS